MCKVLTKRATWLWMGGKTLYGHTNYMAAVGASTNCVTPVVGVPVCH